MPARYVPLGCEAKAAVARPLGLSAAGIVPFMGRRPPTGKPALTAAAPIDAAVRILGEWWESGLRLSQDGLDFAGA